MEGALDGQMDVESGALVGASACHFHVAAVFTDDLLGDVQAEAHAFLAVAGGAADAGVFGEQFYHFIWRQAAAGVLRHRG